MLLALLRPGLECIWRKKEGFEEGVSRSSPSPLRQPGHAGLKEASCGSPQTLTSPQLSISPLKTAKHEHLKKANRAHSQWLTFHFRFKSRPNEAVHFHSWLSLVPTVPILQFLSSLSTDNTSHNLFNVFLNQLDFYYLDMYTFIVSFFSVIIIITEVPWTEFLRTL